MKCCCQCSTVFACRQVQRLRNEYGAMIIGIGVTERVGDSLQEISETFFEVDNFVDLEGIVEQISDEVSDVMSGLQTLTHKVPRFLLCCSVYAFYSSIQHQQLKQLPAVLERVCSCRLCRCARLTHRPPAPRPKTVSPFPLMATSVRRATRTATRCASTEPS